MATTSEQAEYDKRWSSGGYSADRIGYTRFFLRFMTQQLQRGGVPESPTALEIGCGDGFFSSELATRGCRVTGLDFSSAAVEQARRRVPRAEFMVHDLSNPLPFPDGSFDVVWCSEVLEHLFAPLAVLQEVSRVLRPGGILLVTVPYHGLLKNLGIALFAFDRHYDPTYPHIRFFTKKTLSTLVCRANLDPIVVTSCGSGLGIRDLIVPTNLLLAATKPAAA
jgi:SAM-dependent methyltransferase